MAQLKEGSIIRKPTGDEVIATVNDIPEIPTSLPANGGNADTVGGFTVGVDVPSNAKFTDTIVDISGKQDKLTAGNNITITNNTISATDTKYTHPTHTTKANGLYKVTVDNQGHVSATSAVAKADITALGIPAQDTVVDISGKVDKVAGKSLSTEDYTTAEKTKLAGVATGANKYTHPANHPPSIITQDASNRFVTDTEKAAWSGKQNALGYTPVDKAGDKINGRLEIESTVFPVVDIVRNTSVTGSNLYGGAKLERKTTNPSNGVGIGFYFKAPNSAKASTHAGMFGGALGTINAGSERGEIVVAPSYAGQDPYTRRDFVVRAISASKAEAELNGKLRTEQTLASDPINTVATKKYVDDNKTVEYSHPASHPASMITESTSRRFVSDNEKGNWNSKTKTITSATEPSLETGEQWHKEI